MGCCSPVGATVSREHIWNCCETERMAGEQHVKLHEAGASRPCPDGNWSFRFSSFAGIRRGIRRNAYVHRWRRDVHDRVRQVFPQETAQNTIRTVIRTQISDLKPIGIFKQSFERALAGHRSALGNRWAEGSHSHTLPVYFFNRITSPSSREQNLSGSTGRNSPAIPATTKIQPVVITACA